MEGELGELDRVDDEHRRRGELELRGHLEAEPERGTQTQRSPAAAAIAATSSPVSPPALPSLMLRTSAASWRTISIASWTSSSSRPPRSACRPIAGPRPFRMVPGRDGLLEQLQPDPVALGEPAQADRLLRL